MIDLNLPDRLYGAMARLFTDRNLVCAPTSEFSATARASMAIAICSLACLTSASVAQQPTTLPIEKVHDSFISAWACSTDGKRLATGARDGTVALWDTNDLDNPQAIARTLHDEIEMVFFRPGEVLAFDKSQIGSRWDLEKGSKRLMPKHFGSLPRTLCGNGTRLAMIESVTGVRKGRSVLVEVKATIWDLVSMKKLKPIKGLDKSIEGDTSIEGLEFCADGTTLAIAHKGGTITIWDTDSGKRACEIESTLSVGKWIRPIMSLSANGQVLVASLLPVKGGPQTPLEKRLIRLWDTHSGMTLHTIATPEMHQHDNIWTSADGSQLAVSGSTNSGRRLELLSVAKPDERKIIPGKALFSQNRQWAVVAHRTGKAHQFSMLELETGESSTFPGGQYAEEAERVYVEPTLVAPDGAWMIVERVKQDTSTEGGLVITEHAVQVFLVPVQDN